MQLYKKLLLSYSICMFLISNQAIRLAVLASGESKANSATNDKYYSQNIPCGIWAWEFPTNLQDPRLYLEQNDQADAGVDCRAEFSIINNTGIPIIIDNIFSTDVLSYTLELFPQTENSRIEWDFPNNQGLNQYYSIQSVESPFKAIPLNPQEKAKVDIEGRLTAHSLAADIALIITFQIIKLNPCIPVQAATFSAIKTVERGGLDKTAQLLLDHKYVELKKEWNTAAPEFVKAFLEELVVECVKGATEVIVKEFIGFLPSLLLDTIWYGTHVSADYVLRYQKSSAKLTINYQPPAPTEPISLPNQPQIELIVSPPPQPVGTCVLVKAKIEGGEDYGSMRMRFGNAEWLESNETEFERVFCTESYSPGTYKIQVEARGKTDTDWANPSVVETDYELKSLQEMFPNTVVIYGSARQVFPAKIGKDLFFYYGGMLLKSHPQLWRIPNAETAEALCVDFSWSGNPWGIPDKVLLKTPKGPDIPDILKDPEKFWEIRNKYFLPCNWAPTY